MTVMSKKVEFEIRHNSIPNEDTCAKSCQFFISMGTTKRCIIFLEETEFGDITPTYLSQVQRGNLKLYKRCRKCLLKTK